MIHRHQLTNHTRLQLRTSRRLGEGQVMEPRLGNGAPFEEGRV
jgi:hypothetical protein